ncbi:TetR/AcrR family transcriptional regulator [Microbacterium sp.]|uniref:TetR/AcrR family transcriptional regulator n=1 Tax=Microbacterium sp. TaxID=51671 RepID=UPI003A92F148
MTDAPKKRGPYAKSARTRQRAVDAAIEIFSVTGFHGATLTDVAEKLEMTLTGLQHHFPDKDALLAAVLEERDRRSREEIQIVPGEVATDKLIEIVLRNQSQPLLTELHTVLSAEATDAGHPAHEYFVERYRRERASGAKYFRRLMDQNSIGNAADPEGLASLLIAVSDGLQLQWLLDRDAVDLESQVRRFLQIAVPALAAAENTETASRP